MADDAPPWLLLKNLSDIQAAVRPDSQLCVEQMVDSIVAHRSGQDLEALGAIPPIQQNPARPRRLRQSHGADTVGTAISTSIR